MPQMSPLMWLILYIYFLLIYMFINLVIYYLFMNFNINLKFSNNIKKINFKFLW